MMIAPEADRRIRQGIASGVRIGKNSLKALGIIRKNFFCEALFSGRHAAVLSDGTVVCSCFSIKKEIVLGNVNGQSLESVWRGSKTENLRARFRRGKLPSRLCVFCRYFVLRDLTDCYPETAPFPRQLHIETFAGCNLACLSCDREGILRSRGEAKLGMDRFRKMIDEIYARNEFKELNLIGGGEPFLLDDFPDFIRYAKEKNESIPVHTSTNGLLLDSDEMRRKVIVSGLNSIEFTVSGSSQSTYEPYHRGGRFEQAFSNMRRFIEQRREMGERNKPFVIWKYLLFTWNDSDEALERAIDLSRQIGVDRLDFVLTRSPLTGFSRKYVPFRKKYYNKIRAYRNDDGRR